jgi:3-isopropylmalate/(R)-2-methylmalate dehydratase large subunit
MALAHWQTLGTDEGARFDKVVTLRAGDIAPVVTWGTSPEDVLPITAAVPDPADFADPGKQAAAQRSLDYMGLTPGTPMTEITIDRVFIGSCTNSRLSDLRNAAKVLKDRKVAPGVKAICVPGSSQVKLAAEAEGLDRIFTEAGFEWRESGCSMCFFAGGESFGVEERVVTSTNRNFENRQGPRTRSHLASPTTVAASAVLGKLADVRKLEPQE